jgi:ATP-dependent 26S proteasome regulatory subunit
MFELLNQLDGFDSRGDAKVIVATYRIKSLDPALINRPKDRVPIAADLELEECHEQGGFK